MSKNEQKKARFLRHLHFKYKVDQNGCWIWTAKKDSRRSSRPSELLYGRAWFNGKWRTAHRIVKAFLHNIPEILDDPNLICCHKCDNPLCVNPDHIFLGTHADNARDKTLKQRQFKRIKCPHCQEHIDGLD